MDAHCIFRFLDIVTAAAAAIKVTISEFDDIVLRFRRLRRKFISKKDTISSNQASAQTSNFIESEELSQIFDNPVIQETPLEGGKWKQNTTSLTTKS
jgi:hypothetical protein